MVYLVLPGLQIKGDADTRIKLVQAGEHGWYPAGPNVVVVDVVEGVSITAEPQDPIISGILHVVGDAVPFHQGVHSGMTRGAAALWMGMKVWQMARVHLHNFSESKNKHDTDICVL